MSVVSRTPVAPGRWTKVRLENDHRFLLIFLNGRLDAEIPFPAFRGFGPVTVILGGGEEKLSGYRGFIRDLILLPCFGMIF